MMTNRLTQRVSKYVVWKETYSRKMKYWKILSNIHMIRPKISFLFKIRSAFILLLFRNNVKANIGKCIFCDSKLFYADCKKKRKTCSKTYRKIDLEETCPPGMAFAGRLGMKKFFTIKDFITVNPESVKLDIYKNCHTKDKE